MLLSLNWQESVTGINEECLIGFSLDDEQIEPFFFQKILSSALFGKNYKIMLHKNLWEKLKYMNMKKWIWKMLSLLQVFQLLA
jgi:hypothetical protein